MKLTSITYTGTSKSSRRSVAPETERAAPSQQKRVDDADPTSTVKTASSSTPLPMVRQHLVKRVRGEIANGTYETDHKIDALHWGFAAIGSR